MSETKKTTEPKKQERRFAIWSRQVQNRLESCVSQLIPDTDEQVLDPLSIEL